MPFFHDKNAFAGANCKSALEPKTCILAHTCCKNEDFESLIFDAPCGWESRNQTFGALTFWEEAKNCDRGASVGAGGEVIIETRETTPGFFTVKMHPAYMRTAYVFLS